MKESKVFEGIIGNHVKNEEQISRYSTGQYREKGLTSSIDQEILAVNYVLDCFRPFLLNKKKYYSEQIVKQL